MCEQGSRNRPTGKKTSFGSQLKALLWRNYRFKFTEKQKTLSEILLPLVMVLSLVSIKSGMKPFSKPEIPLPFGDSDLTNSMYLALDSRTILAAPNTTQVEEFMIEVIKKLSTYSYEFNYVLVANEKEMATLYRENKTYKVGVVFRGSDLRLNGSYTFKLPFSSLPDPQSRTTTSDKCRDSNPLGILDSVMTCPAGTYYTTGLSFLQYAIDLTFAKTWLGSNVKVPNMRIELLPKPAYTDPATTWRAIVPFYLILSFSPFVSILTIALVVEKERKIKVGMLMMGMNVGAYWMAWFIIESIIVTIVSALISLAVYGLSIFPNTNPYIVFLATMLYGLSTIMISFMMTPFFNNSKVAGSVVGVVMLALSLLHLIPLYLKGKVGSGVFYVVSFLSPTAYAVAIEKISQKDIEGSMDFKDLFSGSFPVGAALIMMAVDIILYGILANYFDHVISGEFGQRYHPLWFLLPRKQSQANESIHTETGGSGETDVEQRTNDDHSKAVIKISGIKKVFKSWGKDPVVAIDGINLSLHEGQISALLGHNGAGKSTLINMLVGMSPPTTGSATLYGYDIRNPKDMEDIRSMMGVCLQEDILFDNLTPVDHLTFFGKLKGLSNVEIKTMTQQLIKDLDLLGREKTKSVNLSGGQKRKLCVAIALIGNPKILFLDEPSSGMDPYSRRRLWAELQRRRSDRIILLTTHFMDEADILADWKAIISHGKLRCAGSSMFLKNRFGLGYHLTIVVDQSTNRNQIINLVKSHVSTAKVDRNTTSELSFILPRDVDSTHYAQLFAAIENDINTLASGIKSYGVSMTTLEEVFLKMADDTSTDSSAHDEPNSSQLSDTSLLPPQTPLLNSTVKSSIFRSFSAFYKLRFLLLIRTPMHVVPLVVFPTIMIVLAHFLMGSTSVYQNTSLSLDASVYKDYTDTFQIFANKLPLANQDEWKNSIDKFSQLNVTYKQGNINKSTLGSKLNLYSQFVNSETQNIQNSTLTMLVNDTYVHALPILQSITFNALIALWGKQKSVPMLAPSVAPFEDLVNLSKIGQMIGLVTMMSVLMSYMPALISLEVVEDRESKRKNQLRVSGLNFFGYWNTVLAVHSTVLLVAFMLIIVAFMIFKTAFGIDMTAVGVIALLFLFQTPSSLMACYVISYIFDKHETAKGMLPFIASMCSLIPTMFVTIMDSFNPDQATSVHRVCCFLFALYLPSGSIYYVTKVAITQAILKEMGVATSASAYFAWENNISVTLVAAVFHWFAMFIVLRIVDVAKDGGRIADALPFNIGRFSPSVNFDLPENEDSDVRAEREKVATTDYSILPIQPVVVMKELRKEYRSGNRCRGREIKVAVRNLSAVVERGDIFGLLGPNGAGKTTSIRIIGGEESPTAGKVQVAGFEITSNQSRAFANVGYCPQHDALWETLTMREHLRLYAALRGIAPERVEPTIDWLMQKLDIIEHANKRVKALSGGTKRKLSYAISTLGRPKIVLLDEPSTGMDPQSKRFLWDTITSMFPRKGERGALMTTHSMEEADALCTRVGIMVTGSLRCLGSTQHLKNRYGAGYTLEIKMSSEVANADGVKSFITELFADNCTLRESFQDRLTYDIPQTAVTSVAKVFSSLQDAKSRFDIEEFSFSQTTLEQVFLAFAKEQEHHDA